MVLEMIVILLFYVFFWFRMIYVIVISINIYLICVWCIWLLLVVGVCFLLCVDVYNYLNVFLFDLIWLMFDFIFIMDSVDK